MSQVFFLHEWRVDPSLRTVSGPGSEVRLEPKQMQVLVLLAEQPGQVVTKDHLLQTVWADTFVGDEVLSRAIFELRRALGDDIRAPRFIQTIPKSGYRLVAPVVSESPESTVVLSARRAWAPYAMLGVLACVLLAGIFLRPRARASDPRATKLAEDALALISVDKPEAAESLAAEAVKINPDVALPHIVLAWARSNRGARPEAYIESAKRAVMLAEAANELETFYFARGSYWHMKGDLAQAARDYETLLKLTPRHYWGLNNLMFAYQGLGRDEWRLLTVRRADASPRNVTDQVVAARVLFISGDLGGAERYAARACRGLAGSAEAETAFGEPWACAVPAYARWVEGRVPDLRAAVVEQVHRTDLQRTERDMALHTLLGAALGIGDLQLADLIATSIDHTPTRLQDQAAIALVRGESAVAGRLALDEAVGTEDVLLQTAAIMADVGLGGVLLQRFGIEPATSSTDAGYLRAEWAWSEGRYPEAMHHLRGTMTRSSGALTGPGGRPVVAVLRSLMMLADAAERQGTLTEALVHLEEARALQREACLGEPLAPVYWLRTQVRLSDLYRRMGRGDDASRTASAVETLVPHGPTTTFYTVSRPVPAAAGR